MEIAKLLDLNNDGLNMAVDENFMYIRCQRSMYKYNLLNMNRTAQNEIFTKDGKARYLSVCDEYVFLTDFCDLYILDKDSLQIAEVMRLGEDLSSDLGVTRFNDRKAYICIRNGKIAIMNINTKEYQKYDISDSSYWDFTVNERYLYIGTVQGELLKIDTSNMKTHRITALGNKNIYSVVIDDNLIYTVSQDRTIKSTNSETFKTICVAKKAVRGMAKILGLYKDSLFVADTNKISVWDKQTLQLMREFIFPTGHFNKGVLLAENKLFGSDYQSVYCAELE